MSLKLPIVPNVQKIKDPKFPQFLFEWHEQSQKVYVIGIPGRFEGGEFVIALTGEARAAVLAEHCEHHARFYGFVQTYLRGYRQGLADQQRKQGINNG